MKTSLKFRTWLITAVNSGFGRHMTEQLLARGDRVAGTVQRNEAMDDLKAKYGDLLWLAHLDMTDTRAIPLVVNKAFAELGKIDVIVNNAGYGLFGAEELSDEQIARSLHQSARPDPFSARGVAPPARTRGRPDYRPVHLWRPSGPSWKVSLSCEQVEVGRLPGFDGSRTRKMVRIIIDN